MTLKSKIPFDTVAILLQGGGALGAYQAGVYQALYEAELEPDWVAGISIGAINAAIIAGNPPKDRVRQLRAFWEGVTMDNFRDTPDMFKQWMTGNNAEHQFLNFLSTLRTVFFGIPGFFQPRMANPFLLPRGSLEAASFCDVTPLKATLENLIDFDRLNKGSMRLNVGAVNILDGNFTNFDNKEITITTDHIMASGALPPGFAPVKIGKDYFWDGGLISNTPLEWLLESKLTSDTLVFQVDLWSAVGEFPQNMAEVLTRTKDIQFSSRTRANTDRFKEKHRMAHTIARLLEELPDKYRELPDAKLLAEHCDSNAYNIVHLIYHNKSYEGYSKDFEFSRLSMEAHWQSGYEDTLRALKHPDVLKRPTNKEGIGIFDFSQPEEVQKKKAVG